MQIVVIFSVVFVATVLAQESSTTEEVTLLKYRNINNVNNYVFEYELSDGQYRQEMGEFKEGEPLPDGTPTGEMNVAGSYKYKTPEGRTVSVTYVADGNGYRPKVTYE